MRFYRALLIVAFAYAFSSGRAAEPTVDDVFTRKKIVEGMRSVRDYQLAHPWKETDRNWIRATYYRA